VVKNTDVYYYLRVKERYAAQGGGTACGERHAAGGGTGHRGGRSCGHAVLQSCTTCHCALSPAPCALCPEPCASSSAP